MMNFSLDIANTVLPAQSPTDFVFPCFRYLGFLSCMSKKKKRECNYFVYVLMYLNSVFWSLNFMDR